MTLNHSTLLSCSPTQTGIKSNKFLARIIGRTVHCFRLICHIQFVFACLCITPSCKTFGCKMIKEQASLRRQVMFPLSNTKSTIGGTKYTEGIWNSNTCTRQQSSYYKNYSSSCLVQPMVPIAASMNFEYMPFCGQYINIISRRQNAS